MIPKIIHQIWIGPQRPPLECMHTWKRQHPGWQHCLWSEQNIDFPLQNSQQYSTARDLAGKSDVLRWEVLARHGGVYIDADSVCLRPLDETLLEKGFFAAYQNELENGDYVATGVLGGVHGHSVITEVVQEIGRNSVQLMQQEPSHVSVGPGLLTRILRQHPDIEILPSYLFYPYHYNGRRCSDDQLCKAYAVQLWGSTVVDKKLDLLRQAYGFSNEKIFNSHGVLYRARDSVPIRNEKYYMETIDNYYVFRHPDHENALICNASGALVWELCDGSRTLRQITGELQARFPEHAPVMEKDVARAIDRLQLFGAITLI